MQIPTEQQIFEYAKFTYNDTVAKECAEDFYLHYETNGWLLGNGNPMANWQAAFKKWVKANETKKNKKGFQNNSDGDGFEIIR
jgi:hypothetical protein